MKELTPDNLEAQAREARDQAERAWRLAKNFANDRIAKDLAEIAEEFEHTAEECERRVHEIVAEQAPSSHRSFG